MRSTGNILAQLGFSLGSALLAIAVPIPVVMSLYFGDAHLGAEGYLIIGVTLFVLLLTSGAVAALLAGWLVDRRTPEGRRPFAILMVVLAVVHLAGFIAIIYVVARAGANAVIAVGLIVAVVLFTVALCVGAESVGRADAKRGALLPPVSTMPAPAHLSRVRRAPWIMLAAFGLVATLGLAAVLAGSHVIEIEDSTPNEDAASLVAGCLFVVAFALLAADVVAIGFLFSVSSQIKALFRGSYAAQKQLFRVVMKGRAEPLDAEAQAAAREFGRLQIQALSFNLASSLIVFAAVAALQVGSLISFRSDYTDFAPLYFCSIAAMFVVAVFGVLFIGRSIRRIQRYLAANPA